MEETTVPTAETEIQQEEQKTNNSPKEPSFIKIKVKDFLTQKKVIPDYQRPYKWTEKNVLQLIEDIIVHKNKSAYRLGTVVIHHDKKTGKKNIVDGQQRTITLILIARAILANIEDSSPIFKKIEKDKIFNFNPEFDNPISQHNIFNNYRAIEAKIKSMDEESMLFFFEKCEFVQFTLYNISEAFQFFDSQNSRGKDLNPHDLLKAYHLREFSQKDEKLKASTIKHWEETEEAELDRLFSQYLYRIKEWSYGNSARYFTRNHLHLFKGINLEENSFPSSQILRFADFQVDRYNNNPDRQLDQNTLEFPFQLDLTIVNGRRFFELVNHYNNMLKTLADISEKELKGEANILNAINSYKGRFRTGDGYARLLFDCCLMYYLDKFGLYEISRAIEKIFIWSYSIRLKQKSLRFSSVDNHAISYGNLFRLIRQANRAEDFLLQPLNIQLKKDDLKGTKVDELTEIFKTLKYYHEQ